MHKIIEFLGVDNIATSGRMQRGTNNWGTEPCYTEWQLTIDVNEIIIIIQPHTFGSCNIF